MTAPEVVDKDSGKSPAKPAVSPGAKESTAVNDPFADGNDAKHGAPATQTKRASPAGSEVKQASASTESSARTPSRPIIRPRGYAGPRAARAKLPGADGPALGDSKPEAAKANDASGPPKPAEPSAGPQIDLPPHQNDADQKDQRAGDAKASGGPQLPAGPSLDLPPTTSAAPENTSTPKPATSNPPFPDRLTAQRRLRHNPCPATSRP